MNLREHLKNMHVRMGEHHLTKSRHHAKLAEHYSGLAEGLSKADGEAAADYQGIAQSVAEMHQELSAHHADEAEFHIDCAKTLSATTKAAGMGDDDDLRRGIVADEVVGIIPDSQVKPVFRTGQPEFSTPAAPRGFEWLTKTTDD